MKDGKSLTYKDADFFMIMEDFFEKHWNRTNDVLIEIKITLSNGHTINKILHWNEAWS